MITLFILQFLATFSIVGFRLLQNLNSVHSRYVLMLPTTLGIALSEIYIINMIANGELAKVPLIIAMTLGGWLGCVGVTILNNYLKKDSNHTSISFKQKVCEVFKNKKGR